MSTTAAEQFKPFPGFAEYMVSDRGRIWSNAKKGFICERQPNTKLPPNFSPGTLQMTKARAVATVWVPNPQNLPRVTHRDRDWNKPTFEWASNLVWVGKPTSGLPTDLTAALEREQRPTLTPTHAPAPVLAESESESESEEDDDDLPAPELAPPAPPAPVHTAGTFAVLPAPTADDQLTMAFRLLVTVKVERASGLSTLSVVQEGKEGKEGLLGAPCALAVAPGGV